MGIMGKLLDLVTSAFLGLFLLCTVAVSTPAAPVVCGADLAVAGAQEEPLRRFAQSMGIEHVDAFVNLVRHVDANGSLPECYLTKAQAARAGWSPGRRLWKTAPGGAIGGDRFGNRERRLPARYDGRYLEADLDYDGGGRGPKRLVFVEGQPRSGLIWITTDHYRTFHQVPRP